MSNRIKPLNTIMYLSFFVSMILYIATLKLRPYPFSYLVKIIPIVCLILIAYFNIPGKKGKIIIGALLLSAIGDVILALNGTEYFVYGLSSFALAHCLYIWSFTGSPVIIGKRSIFVLLFIIYGIIMAYILIPELGKMLIPVLLYLTIIISMGVTAAIGRNNNYLVVIGAFIFMVSDSIIALNMFHSRIPFASFLIMITYFPAQFLITFGSTKSLIILKE